MSEITIRAMRPEEVGKVAAFIAAGYHEDVFFKWVVADEAVRHAIVTDYYKVYLQVPGAHVHVAECPTRGLVGATVWLPHDVDASIYDDINQAAGAYAPHFQAVADKSHLSEPPMVPFYQLVGVVVDKAAQGQGIGGQLLGHQLAYYDSQGIPTYLEASTPYFGGGVYGKFGYQPVGELMEFGPGAVLYPLWRPAQKLETLEFGGRPWQVLQRKAGKALLMSQEVLSCPYHDELAITTWENSAVRRYLNTEFLEAFTQSQRQFILETKTAPSHNPWFGTDSGAETSDSVFLLSVEELLKHLGSPRQLYTEKDAFYINDGHNSRRKATLADGTPARWVLRTPGKQDDFVCTVTNDGRISMTGDFVNRQSTDLFKVGVRPCIWIEERGLAQ